MIRRMAIQEEDISEIMQLWFQHEISVAVAVAVAVVRGGAIAIVRRI